MASGQPELPDAYRPPGADDIVVLGLAMSWSNPHSDITQLTSLSVVRNNSAMLRLPNPGLIYVWYDRIVKRRARKRSRHSYDP